jgi:hypothetical protein
MTQAERDVQEYCQMLVKLHAGMRPLPDGWSYSCMEDFLLDRGQFWTPAPLPKRVKPMRPKECFFNALKLVMRRRKTLRYVEGVALSMIATHHAWAVDAAGTVIDPTWETPGSAYFGVVFDLGERLLAAGPVLADYVHGYPVFRQPRVNGLPSRS